VKSSRPIAAIPTPLVAAAFLATALLLSLSGCTTARPPAAAEPVAPLAPPVQKPEPVLSHKPKPKPTPAPQPAPARVAPEPAVTTNPEPVPAPPERLKIRVETIPQGAMIVVDGRPMGRAPLDLEFDAASNGFFKVPVTIRARFVASDATSESFSIDGQFGPLERIPLGLVFSHEGVQRILRQY
jgi:hypothetical protein